MDRRKDIARDIARHFSVVLSTEGLNQLAEILVPFKYKARTEMLEAGQVCQYMFYIDRGLVIQHYSKGAKDVVEHISNEGGIVICIESFFTQKESKLGIRTIEPTIAYGLPHDPLYALARESHEFCLLIFAILEQSLIISQQKADVLRFEDVKSRYFRTLKETPEIIRRTPLHYVASYLQMAPETLSRVRALPIPEE